MHRTILALAVAAIAAATPSIARADAIDDPCQVQQLGAPCTDRDGEAGTCQEGEFDDLVCVASGATTSTGGATTGGTTTGGATTGGATTGGAGGGDDGGAGGGSSGGAAEDDGCAVKAPGRKSATRGGAAAVFLGALALTALRAARRARRGRDAS